MNNIETKGKWKMKWKKESENQKTKKTREKSHEPAENKERVAEKRKNGTTAR